MPVLAQSHLAVANQEGGYQAGVKASENRYMGYDMGSNGTTNQILAENMNSEAWRESVVSLTTLA